MTARFSRGMLRSFVVALIGFGALVGSPVRADDFTTAFETANKLYVDGRFADAAAAYEAMIQTGNVSEAILFNHGNALFREGKIGQAICAYREAQLLAPRDPDVRANLQFARTRARGGAPYHGDHWKAWLQKLSVNEWTGAAGVFVSAFFILLAVAQWRAGLGAVLRGYIVAVGAVALLLCAGLGIELSTDFYAQTAIVTTGEADVRLGPFEEAPSLYKVRDGLELEVLDRKDNWLQVADSAQRVGWVRKDQVITFKPAAAANSQGSSGRNG